MGGTLSRNKKSASDKKDKKAATATMDYVQPTTQTQQQQTTTDESFLPVVQEFQRAIETDTELYILFHQMFEQIPEQYDKDPSGKPQVRDYKTMLKQFDVIIRQAPDFDKELWDSGFIGFPINTIFNWPMATPAGLAAFRNDKVNKQIKNMLSAWGQYLSSPASANVLNEGERGWFGPLGIAAMPNFSSTFQCDPKAPHWGFTSWDDFFTRKFRDGLRPIYAPNDDNIVNSACESQVYKIANQVKAHERFWLKGEPYSLSAMLNYDPWTEKFVGGTIYQAYLSAMSYHRWHSPVNGKVVKKVVVPGTYYAQSPANGFPDVDACAPILSQAWLTAVATRVLLFIQADNPKIGLMCFMAVGTTEVSSVDARVKEGDRLRKGDELGMFHFGGSTYVLVFRPGVNVEFHVKDKEDVLLNARLATIS